MRCLLLFAVLCLSTSSVWAGSFVYLSIGGESKIAIYDQNTQSGELKHLADVELAGAPGALAFDPARKYLFATVRSTNSLASFRIDEKTGGLKPINAVELGANPAYAATDRTGRFLLTAYYGEGKIGVHAIGEDGAVGDKALQWIETAKNAHAILPDLSNRFVFVPHTGPNAVFQFKFTEKTGELTANEPAKVTTPDATGPRHLAFHPSGKFVFFDNEQGSSVTAYKLSGEQGTLEPLQTVTTLPNDFKENNSCADIELTPNAKFLYASNRGHDSLAGYQVDAASGKLTPLGQTPTEQTPRSFSVDPDGKFLYAAGQGNGQLAAYRIDPKSGKLERLATYPVGKSPAWVKVIKLPD